MTQQREEMVIFTRSFDFLSWLLPMTNHFPRAQRHSFTRRKSIPFQPKTN